MQLTVPTVYIDCRSDICFSFGAGTLKLSAFTYKISLLAKTHESSSTSRWNQVLRVWHVSIAKEVFSNKQLTRHAAVRILMGHAHGEQKYSWLVAAASSEAYAQFSWQYQMPCSTYHWWTCKLWQLSPWIWTNISIVNSFIYLLLVIHPFVCSFVCSTNQNMCMSVRLLFFWTALRCCLCKAQISFFFPSCASGCRLTCWQFSAQECWL